jgi:hypothetical protein
MSIEYTCPGLIRPETVLYSRKETVNAIALMAIVNMINSSMDMMIDCPNDYNSKEDIDRVLAGAGEQAIEFVHDAIDELKAAVIERLRTGKLTVRIKAMKFAEEDGELDDLDVIVKFE